VFVELDRRKNAGYTVSLEWDRDTGETQIVLADSRDASVGVFLVQGVKPATRSAIRSGTRREHPRFIDEPRGRRRPRAPRR
jgi:hypothetical protein